MTLFWAEKQLTGPDWTAPMPMQRFVRKTYPPRKQKLAIPTTPLLQRRRVERRVGGLEKMMMMIY
jgi:hypothetical protein